MNTSEVAAPVRVTVVWPPFSVSPIGTVTVTYGAAVAVARVKHLPRPFGFTSAFADLVTEHRWCLGGPVDLQHLVVWLLEQRWGVAVVPDGVERADGWQVKDGRVVLCDVEAR